MTRQKSTKRALLMSGLALLVCVSMLIGSTFAWFTDNVTSAGNIIKSGKLEVTMKWKDATANGAQQTYKDASLGAIFNYSLWEPGYVEAKNVKISNIGSLALKYNLNIVANGEVSELADVIEVYFAEGEYTLANREMTELTLVGTLSEVLDGMPANMNGALTAGASDTVTIALKMQETAGNEYQELAIGTDFKVVLLATQDTVENDSFNNQYDKNAGWTGAVSQPEQDENGVFQIGSPEELAWFAQYVNGTLPTTFSARAAAPQGHNAVLTADINLNNLRWTPIGRVPTDEESAAGAHSFDYQYHGQSNVSNYAVFDGQGHTVYNLNVSEKQNAGLFGAAVYATIKNVNVEGAKIVSNHFAGTVLAQGYARVENCHVKDATVICTPELVDGEWDNGDKVGGVVGKISEGGVNTIYGAVDCSATNVKVTAYRDAAGILGYAGNYAKVTGNTVTDVTITQDASHDYKAFTSAAKYNLNSVVGDSTRATGVVVDGNSGEAEIIRMATSTAVLKESVDKEGATVNVAAGNYTFPTNIAEGVTLVCEEGTVFEGNSKLNINGATVVGADFSNPTGTAVDQTINGTFKDCTFSGKNGLRWCYAGETVVFENCVFDGKTYGVHFDGGANEAIFKNCTISGFNAMGGAITKLTMEGCTFKPNGKSGYNGINLWGNTEMKNCTFVFDGTTTEWIDACGDNTTLTFTGCIISDGTTERALTKADVGDYGTGNTITVG